MADDEAGLCMHTLHEQSDLCHRRWAERLRCADTARSRLEWGNRLTRCDHGGSTVDESARPLGRIGSPSAQRDRAVGQVVLAGGRLAVASTWIAVDWRMYTTAWRRRCTAVILPLVLR